MGREVSEAMEVSESVERPAHFSGRVGRSDAPSPRPLKWAGLRGRQGRAGRAGEDGGCGGGGGCGGHSFAEGAAAGQDAAAVRAAAMLPMELLQPGEIIILLLKPSPWFIVLAPLKTLVMLTLLVVATAGVNVQLQLGIASRDLMLLGVGLVGARLFWQFLEWLSRVYVLTDQRVVRVRGVLRVYVFESRLREIQHTEIHFRIRERLFGLGTIAFATAGTAAQEAYWQMVARPLEVHQKVVETLRRYRR